MIAPTEEPKLEDMTIEPKEKDTPQLATHTVPTLVGYTNLQTLKIEGFLKQQSVIILIDTGNTHNLMSNKVAAHLMLQKEYYNGFEVKTMMLKVFHDDDLGFTAHDCEKEQEKGIDMTPTAMMLSISMLALPERDNVFILGADTSRVGISPLYKMVNS
ncbi:hypothetical protein B296_00020024 [Ensete ventricosum]|uniref:Uncharacterized protein n=1 Tax=Ensete ventricosum TaxID=4639 RepID=A0A426X146_ENSVE|nr:hypothetical protein B296_00020024 [Ensete ventricosum]